MRIAIFDAFSGAGGNMIISTLLGISLNEEDLSRIIKNLGLNVSFAVENVINHGIQAKRVVVECEQVDRRFEDVVSLIKSSPLEDEVKKESVSIFERIAKAEGKIHGRDFRRAVFHEVGSDDAIFDVVASVTGILRLKKIGYRFFTTPIRLGEGFIEMHHGRYKVPAPATLEILKNSKLEVVFGGEGELLTPTAAAILSHFCEGTFRQPFIVEDVSYGAGSRETAEPNILRLILGRSSMHDSVAVLETLVDDASGEIIGYAMEKIAEKALDVSAMPAIGKKGRPAVLIRAVAKFSHAEEVARAIMNETGSIGVRIIPVYHRMVAPREEKEITMELFGKEFKIRVKKSNADVKIIKPEFKDVKKVAEELNMPITAVYREICKKLGE
jgi:uncharacterized protein (TIGR00299 family) protein